jgi:hypothetical protein
MAAQKRTSTTLWISRVHTWSLTTWLLVMGAASGNSAEPRPAGVQPLDKDATRENAFAALGADTIPDGRLFAPCRLQWDCTARGPFVLGDNLLSHRATC